jgi:uncharacterized protein (DUF433 family)
MNLDLVKRDPEIMSGALCFSGTLVPVKNLFDYLEDSSSLEEFLEDIPMVSRSRAVAVQEMLLVFIRKQPAVEVEAAWDAEIERRLVEFDRGEIEAIDGEEVLAKAQALACR